MRHVLVMGVSGVGKSTVARAIAESTRATFVEADLYHPPENIACMSAGKPLTDALRANWLDGVAAAARQSPGRAVIACSALKQIYRDKLENLLGPLVIVHLFGDRALLVDRMTRRTDHFMPASLIDSQFADLEPPSGPDTTAIDVAGSPRSVIGAALDFVRTATGTARENDVS